MAAFPFGKQVAQKPYDRDKPKEQTGHPAGDRPDAGGEDLGMPSEIPPPQPAGEAHHQSDQWDAVREAQEGAGDIGQEAVGTSSCHGRDILKPPPVNASLTRADFKPSEGRLDAGG